MIEVQFPSYNAINKEYSNDIFLRVYVSAFTEGLVAKLKPSNFVVFLAVCSFMDAKGECYPTQRQIAERTGLSKTTVNRAITDLLAFEVNDQPILQRRLVGTNGNSVYTVLPIGQIAIFDRGIQKIQQLEPEVEGKTATARVEDESKPIEESTFKTAKDVLTYYTGVYRNVYGVNPNIRWPAETALLKKKWIGHYTDDQIRQMIDISVTEYDQRWKNSKFPRPTVSGIVSWIGETALAFKLDEEKKLTQIQEETGGEDEAEAQAAARMAQLFNM